MSRKRSGIFTALFHISARTKSFAALTSSCIHTSHMFHIIRCTIQKGIAMKQVQGMELYISNHMYYKTDYKED